MELARRGNPYPKNIRAVLDLSALVEAADLSVAGRPAGASRRHSEARLKEGILWRLRRLLGT